MDFENVTIPIPKEYDQYLSYIYGEYNKLHDQSQRDGHGDSI
ncbi:LicD family protein [Clostridium hominis]